MPDLTGLKVPLIHKGLGGVGHHVGQQGPLVVLLRGPQQLQPRLEQLAEVLHSRSMLLLSCDAALTH